MILVWGLRADSTTAAVLAKLDRLGADALFLDQRQLLGPGLATADVELAGSGDGRGSLWFQGARLDLWTVGSAYLRPYDARSLLGEDADPVRRQRAVALEGLLWAWADLAPARIVNRPANMAANGSKPFQSRQIRESGFAVPETLVTTDPGAAEHFLRKHGEVVYKSISGARSVVRKLSRPDDWRWPDLGTCPVQFQEYVPGVDFRVHVVSDDVFCAQVDSDADDYRYPSGQGMHTTIGPAHLPPEIRERSWALAVAQGLPVAGIDLRRTPEGEWYCFEVNPSPAFSYFDLEEQPIACAVAALLAAPSRN